MKNLYKDFSVILYHRFNTFASKLGGKINMTETNEMLEIIHQNRKIQFVRNQVRAKKQKRQAIVDSIIMFLGSSIFMIGLMTFIAMIESMRF